MRSWAAYVKDWKPAEDQSCTLSERSSNFIRHACRAHVNQPHKQKLSGCHPGLGFHSGLGKLLLISSFLSDQGHRNYLSIDGQNVGHCQERH